MRRKPYSDLLALANGGAQKATQYIAPAKPLAVSSHPSEKPMSPEAAAKCRAELKMLVAMIDQHRRSTDAEGQKMCLFVDEKLSDAAVALNRGDGDGSWIQLFGAAKLCRTFQIQAGEAERVISRLNAMLG